MTAAQTMAASSHVSGPARRGHRLPFNGSQRFPLERHCLGSEKAKLGHGCTPSMQSHDSRAAAALQ